MARVLDDMVTFISTQQNMFNVSAVNAASSLQSYSDALDKYASSGAYSNSNAFGSVHYLGMLAGMNNLLTPSSPAAAGISLNTVFNDANGKAYPAGQVCVTSACLAATVSAVNAAPVTDIAATLGFGTASRATSLTRQGVLQILWVVPALLCMLGIVSLSARFCCRTAPRWQKAAPACMTGGIICATPWMFILIALVWPLIMLLGDVCATGVNIGVNVLLSYGDDVCASVGGAGGLNACAFSRALPFGNTSASLTVPILPIYRDVFGACAGVTPSTDPLANVLDQLATQLQTIPVSVATNLLANASTGSFALQPPLAAVLTSAAAMTGRGLAAYATGLSSTALSCPTINNAVFVAKDSVCSSIVPPLFWLVSAWYMIAWVLCCCGIPAGLLGRKRFTTDLWGPVYDELLDQTEGTHAPLRSIRSAADVSANGPAGLVLRQVKAAPAYADDAIDEASFYTVQAPMPLSASSEPVLQEETDETRVVVVPQTLHQH